MSTIVMKDVDGTFKPCAIEDDPFSDYVHHEEVRYEQQESDQPQVATQQLRAKEDLFESIDRVFEGANFVFGIADHVMKHLQRRR